MNMLAFLVELGRARDSDASSRSSRRSRRRPGEQAVAEVHRRSHSTSPGPRAWPYAFEEGHRPAARGQGRDGPERGGRRVAKIGDEDSTVGADAPPGGSRAPHGNDDRERVTPMAVDERSFDPKDIAQALRHNVESYTPLGRARGGRPGGRGRRRHRPRAGPPGAMASELLEFPGGVLGLAFNLDEDEIGYVVLGESSQIEEGDIVKQTGRILRSRSVTGSSGGSSILSASRSTGRVRSRRRKRGCSRSRPPTSSTASR